MIGSLIVASTKEILNSPIRRIAIALVMLGVISSEYMSYTSSFAIFHQKAFSLPSAYLPAAVAIFGAGIIGNDYTGGILPLVFTRPFLRWKYIIGKLTTVAVLSILLMLVLNSIVMGMALVFGGSMPSWQTLAIVTIDQALQCIGLSAVLVFFSTLLPSLGDIALYGALCGVVSGLQMMAMSLSMPGLKAVAADLQSFINPSLDLRLVLFMQTPSYAAILTYASFVAMFITAAVIVINRKEIGYGAE